ncbi:MAG: TolC family protein [Bacteroidales bacterium]|nr:TolC family protein [Bacteroidales bacterium]
MKSLHFLFFILLTAIPAAQAQTYTLEQCKQMAIENNRDLQKAKLDISMAKEDKASAFTKYFPSISATSMGFTGAHHLVRGTVNMPQMGITDMPLSLVKNGVITEISAMQPIFAGGQIVTGNKLASIQQEVARLQYNMTEKDVLQNVTEYYWQVVSLRANLRTLNAALAQLQEVRRLTADYVNAGVTTRNDLLRVELKQQEVESQRLTVENGLQLTLLVLGQLVGAESGSFEVADNLDTNPASPDNYFIAPDVAVLGRDEMALTQKAVDAQRLQTRMEVGKNLPTLSIGAAGMHQYLMKEGKTNLIGMASLSIPISSWWGGSHAIRKAKMARMQADYTRLDTQEKLVIDIQSAWNNLNEAYKQIGIARKSVESSDEDLRIEADSYRSGTHDLTDLLDAVTINTQCQSRLIQACATYQSRLNDYLRKTR